MIEYMTLGPTPCAEDCAQVGQPDYYAKSRNECERYRKQLEATFPIPENVVGWFRIKTFPHDFGDYREVCVMYDDRDEASIDWALHVESHTPEYWDANPRPIPFVTRPCPIPDSAA
jgi:hypothetical protein